MSWTARWIPEEALFMAGIFNFAAPDKDLQLKYSLRALGGNRG